MMNAECQDEKDQYIPVGGHLDKEHRGGSGREFCVDESLERCLGQRMSARQKHAVEFRVVVDHIQ